MEPNLRPADPDAPSAPCPPGHVAVPAGLWQGRHTEVVYDPSSHDVAFVRGGSPSERLAGQMRSCGYQRHGGDGTSELWVRDRAQASKAALERSASAPSRSAGLAIG